MNYGKLGSNYLSIQHFYGIQATQYSPQGYIRVAQLHVAIGGVRFREREIERERERERERGREGERESATYFNVCVLT